MAYGQQDLAHPVKLVKGLVSPPDQLFTSFQGFRFYWKLLFEFWGFCINGTTSLDVPGGFASSNGFQVPTDFNSGSSTHLAQGSDGQTTFGTNTFVSTQANFVQLNLTGSLNNKYITLWKPDDNSPDDSVYRIIGVESANQLRVDVMTGGTTRLGGKAYFSDRSGIRYRIFDPLRIVNLPAWTSTISSTLVLNLSDAPNVNPGQLVSQVQLDLTGSFLRMAISPSGSWNGTGFTDSAGLISSSWFPSAGTIGQGIYYLWGGRDFMISFLKGEDGAFAQGASIQPGFHVEIPERLYPKASDPNPVAWLLWSNSAGPDGLSPITGAYGAGWQMVGSDNATRNWFATTRVPEPPGTNVHFSITPASGGLWYGLTRTNPYGPSTYNVFSGSHLTSDAILMQTGSNVSAQYSLSRARLRRVRFGARNLKPNMRLSERWLHVGGGILWPWDGSMLPFGVFWEGGAAQQGEDEG